MSATFRSLDDLREALAERAEEVRVPSGLAPRAVEAAGRLRRRQQAVVLVACIAVLASLVIQIQQWEETPPARPAPTLPQNGASVGGPVDWSEALPGLDLPVGVPVRVPYGVSNSVFADGEEHPIPGGVDGDQSVVQLSGTPLGILTVTKLDDFPVFNIRLLGDQGVRDIGGVVDLSGSVAVGAGADDTIHIAYVHQEADAQEVQEGPLLDPRPLAVPAARRQAVGFLNGDPLFSRTDELLLEHVHSGDGPAEVSSQQLRADTTAGEQHLLLAGWTTVGSDALAIYTDTDSGCTYAYRFPGPGTETWTACENGEHAVMVVGSQYGAVGTAVYDLASGVRTTTFDLPEAARFEIAAIGWETPEHLIVRVVSYEPYDGAAESASTVPPRYVAVRCAVETGECERLPHPVEVITNNVGSVLPPS